MYKKRIRRVSQKAADFIDHCPVEDFANMNATWVAHKMKVHLAYLSRIFKEDFHCNLKKYIERAKMDQAKELLETTELPVKKIAELLDYTNPSYFIKKFRGHNGMPPNEFRKKTYSLPLKPNKLSASENEKEEPLLQIAKKRFYKYVKKKFSK